MRRGEDLRDPAAVKAVLTPWRDAAGAPVTGAWRAIYFSRSPVPAARDWSDDLLAAEPPLYWQHVGLYAYRRSVLEGWHALPESRLATLESLEQLRVVEAGSRSWRAASTTRPGASTRRRTTTPSWNAGGRGGSGPRTVRSAGRIAAGTCRTVGGRRPRV